jgi:methylated-DNA-[protein]-cysteine S-methyltransferase
MQLRVERHSSPLGVLLLVSSPDGALRALDYEAYEARMLRLLSVHYGSHTLHSAAPSAALAGVLEAYFSGALSALDQLAIATGGTAFQRAVWQALRAIPAGETLSYGQLAARLGRPNASRAVGLANGQNPIAIVVPCHRVIGADGSLTGYAGGVERKRWLLAHERAQPRPARPAARDFAPAPSSP